VVDKRADSPGKCPLCAKEMAKAGTYMCSACDTTSDKPGKCGCGRDYVKTELAGKKCGGCGYYIAKDAKSCPVCNARAKKMVERQQTLRGKGRSESLILPFPCPFSALALPFFCPFPPRAGK